MVVTKKENGRLERDETDKSSHDQPVTFPPLHTPPLIKIARTILPTPLTLPLHNIQREIRPASTQKVHVSQ